MSVDVQRYTCVWCRDMGTSGCSDRKFWLKNQCASIRWLPMITNMYTCTSVWCREMGTYVQRQWKEVRVGDCVELECDEVIPADILLLANSDPQQTCYIQTANIDGETNLTQRQIMPGTVDYMLPLVRTTWCI